jgi:hypothetical protein
MCLYIYILDYLLCPCFPNLNIEITLYNVFFTSNVNYNLIHSSPVTYNRTTQCLYSVLNTNILLLHQSFTCMLSYTLIHTHTLYTLLYSKQCVKQNTVGIPGLVYFLSLYLFKNSFTITVIRTYFYFIING